MEHIREEKVRINRILKIDDAIRANKYPNASTLAKELEVTQRTILRDLDYLRDMYRAPIEYDYTKRGFYYSEPNFFIKSVILTEGELFSIALFDQFLEQYRNTPLEGQLRAIFDKIRTSLPDNVTLDSAGSFAGSSGFSRTQTTFIPDAPVSIDPKVFEGIFKALGEHKTFTGKYRSLSSVEYKERTLDPYHAICHRGYWYIICYSHENETTRTYLFQRFKDIKLTKRHFQIPESFNKDLFFDRHMGVFNTGGESYTFEFILHKDIGTYAAERFYHQTQTVEQRPDGSVYVRFTTNQIAEVLRWALSQGDMITVLNPPEFVETVKEKIEKMHKLYK
ncbi:DeoR family transcriptional regulator [Spirochaetia bacterium]|nr:DeoR family transcriptional regulator [Spirochaetia bacterium]